MDSANQARIVSLNESKEYNIVCDKATQEEVVSKIKFVELLKIKVKGKSKYIRTFKPTKDNVVSLNIYPKRASAVNIVLNKTRRKQSFIDIESEYESKDAKRKSKILLNSLTSGVSRIFLNDFSFTSR